MKNMQLILSFCILNGFLNKSIGSYGGLTNWLKIINKGVGWMYESK